MRNTAQEIDLVAAEWVARMDCGPLNAQDAAALDAWLSEDPRHQGALLRAEAAWSLVGRADVATLTPKSVFSRRAIWAPLAACAGLAAALVVYLLLPPPSTGYATMVGEIRRVPLPDGSVAVIDTDSHVRVSVGRSSRNVVLAEGRAWFEVAKDPSRPFLVDAGGLRVRAVGTAFAVEKLGEDVEILVSEGVVEVLKDGRPVGRIGRGDQIVLRDGRLVASHAVASEDDLLAWRQGQIVMHGQSLEEAVREFNRYNKVQIVVSDARVSEATVVGWFKLNDPTGFAEAAAKMLNAKLERDGSQLVIGPATT